VSTVTLLERTSLTCQKYPMTATKVGLLLAADTLFGIRSQDFRCEDALHT